MTVLQPGYEHVLAMTDRVGLLPDRLPAGRGPRTGHRVADAARGLVVLCRAQPSGPVAQAAWACLGFVRGCQRPDGRVVDRREGMSPRPGVEGAADAVPGVSDGWGLALWGLGTAAARGRDPELARRALVGFGRSCDLRSPGSRAMAFAGLGAAEVLRTDSGHQGAHAVLTASAEAVVGSEAAAGPEADAGPDAGYPGWPWPSSRLTYANAVVPDVLLAAGDVSGDRHQVARGLDLLGWLLDLQSGSGHLSVVPRGGWSPGEPWPGADQRPVEVSALADACARAFELTGDARWSRALQRCTGWFFGENDTGTPLADPASSGCLDALLLRGGTVRRGAEASLALASTLQHAARLGLTR